VGEWSKPPRIPVTLDDLQRAVVYDEETLVNCFSLEVSSLFGDWSATFEISEFRDDRQFILAWIEYWRANRIPMIGFNNLLSTIRFCISSGKTPARVLGHLREGARADPRPDHVQHGLGKRSVRAAN
jgi:hypothetical protein